jgi:hypothetical protein
MAKLFAEDPAAASARVQSAAIVAQAMEGATSPTMGRARAILALRAASAVTLSDDLLGRFGDDADQQVLCVIEEPSRSLDDIAAKLAILTRIQCEGMAVLGGDLPAMQSAFLIATTLADAVVLRAGPIALPEGATEQATAPEAVAWWRQLSAEMNL